MNPSPLKAVKWNAKQAAKVVINLAFIVSLALAIVFIELYVDPYKRGFFCEDADLKYPLKDNTYPGWTLVVIAVAPLVIMLFTESIIFKCSLKKTGVETSKLFGVYIFGFLLHLLLVEYIKFSVGRLRPHFFDVCQPILPDGTDCSSPGNHGVYITNFSCSNPDVIQIILRQFPLSFPSGHSSISFYAMTYMALYIHGRWKLSKMFTFASSFLCFLFAASVAMSRVTDYWHFWTDVCAGSLIGFVAAVLVVRFVSHLPGRKRGFKKSAESQINFVDGV